MLESEAFPVVFFMLSFFAFAIALLYALARAWEKALSTRAEVDRASAARPRSDYSRPAATLAHQTTNLSSSGDN
jgi:hypothetical protein